MPQTKKAAVSNYATPPVKVKEGPFVPLGVAATLRNIRYQPSSRRELRKIINSLNASAIWYWYERDCAKSPTYKTVVDIIDAIERHTGALMEELSPSGPGAWHDPDDFSQEASPALVRLLETQLHRSMTERLASARRCGNRIDETIGMQEVFGAGDPAELLRTSREQLAVLYDATKRMRQTMRFDFPVVEVRPEAGFIASLEEIYRRALGREPKRTIDRITGQPSGPWFTFVLFCCRTAGIDVSPQTIDGWLRGRLSTAAGQTPR
jgi:hypothetical protein